MDNETFKSKEIHYLDQKRIDTLLKSITNQKHKTIALIMIDTGLRVSECVTLKIKNFDFRKKTLIVKSLKKRGENTHREIPISNRLLLQLSQYLAHKKLGENDYIFEGNDNGHLGRHAVNRSMDRLKKHHSSLSQLHPHALRHTFATQLLASGTELHNIKTMLGHKSLDTTLIYSHTPIEVLRQNIENSNTHKLSLWQRFKNYLNPPKQIHFNYSLQSQNFIIGRDQVLNQITSNLNRNINTILIGGTGIGKTHILNNLQGLTNKVLKIDELSNLKLTFLNLLMYLYDNDKEQIKTMIYGDFDRSKILTKLQRDSVYTLIEEIIKVTTKHEYIILVNNVDNITAKAIKTIELLKDHFTIITTAREITVNKSTFLWNFERINIPNLDRESSIQLIHKLSYDIDVEDMALYRNHIYDQSEGNPRIIFELCERYRKENLVTDDVIRSVHHLGALPEIDMTFLVVFVLAGLTILRYTSREVGGTSLRFIGGIALVGLMLFRLFLSKTKRKFI
jgi:DNA replication protein DnaC